ncbi:ribonuclease III domain-containing protein [Apodospora peruviana]|uniref:Ribonuclease III domain-containing protein n=1 Tax=Apodospora peruviana TaxID=516989 RepID=A0AAE0I043_9PEZI|nr:ribonuclease III domain-containing protein [Apodospora peruviana]
MRPGRDARDPLKLLLDNAEELINCLRGLQSDKAASSDGQSFKFDHLDELTKKNLSSLGEKLLPAFQRLANKKESQPAAQPAAAEVIIAPSPPLPSHAFVTKWTTPTLTRSHPPLPAVMDPALEAAALTHSGQIRNPSELSYERLEWIGDIYCELIATSLIYQTFSRLEPGRASQFREMLVRNSTLSTFSRHYGLDKRANFPAEFGLGGRSGGTSASSKQREKVLGDVFEAYVGAVVLSDAKNGVQRAADWLKALWGPILEKHIRDEERNWTHTNVSSPIVSPKSALEATIGTKGIKIEYRDLPSNGKKEKDTNLPLFTVGCYLNGWGETDKQLGYGSALNKKEAGQKAAQAALNNKKLIKVYTDKKKAYLAARAAQADTADQQAS